MEKILGKDLKNHHKDLCCLLNELSETLDDLVIFNSHDYENEHFPYASFPTISDKDFDKIEIESYADACVSIAKECRMTYSNLRTIWECIEHNSTLAANFPELDNLFSNAMTQLIALMSCRFSVHFKPIFLHDLKDEYVAQNVTAEDIDTYDRFEPIITVFPSKSTASWNRDKIRSMSDVSYGMAIEEFVAPFIKLRDDVGMIEADESHPAHADAVKIYSRLYDAVTELRFDLAEVYQIDVFNTPVRPNKNPYDLVKASFNHCSWLTDDIMDNLKDALNIGLYRGSTRAAKLLYRQLLTVYTVVNNTVDKMMELLGEYEQEDFADGDLFSPEDVLDTLWLFEPSPCHDAEFLPMRDLPGWSKLDLETVKQITALMKTDPYQDFDHELRRLLHKYNDSDDE